MYSISNEAEKFKEHLDFYAYREVGKYSLKILYKYNGLIYCRFRIGLFTVAALLTTDCQWQTCVSECVFVPLWYYLLILYQ